MKLTALQRQRLRQQAERILHVPGNFTGGILEMALVLDMRLSLPQREETAAELARALKQQSEVFRNVRLNLAEWRPGEKIRSRVLPLAKLIIGDFTEEYVPGTGDLAADGLFEYLRVFQARSKLIFVLSAGGVRTEDEGACRAALKPFLGRKLCWIGLGEEPAMKSFLEAERAGFLDFSEHGGG